MLKLLCKWKLEFFYKRITQTQFPRLLWISCIIMLTCLSLTLFGQFINKSKCIQEKGPYKLQLLFSKLVLFTKWYYLLIIKELIYSFFYKSNVLNLKSFIYNPFHFTTLSNHPQLIYSLLTHIQKSQYYTLKFIQYSMI